MTDTVEYGFKWFALFLFEYLWWWLLLLLQSIRKSRSAPQVSLIASFSQCYCRNVLYSLPTISCHFISAAVACVLCGMRWVMLMITLLNMNFLLLFFECVHIHTVLWSVYQTGLNTTQHSAFHAVSILLLISQAQVCRFYPYLICGTPSNPPLYEIIFAQDFHIKMNENFSVLNKYIHM